MRISTRVFIASEQNVEQRSSKKLTMLTLDLFAVWYGILGFNVPLDTV